MSRPLLSVIVIVVNEEAKIARCLGSVRWADEIVVVDSGSTDRTVDVCKGFTSNVRVRPFTDYADQKNYALSLAAGDWVLSLDADEEVTAPLCEEIKSTIASPKAVACRIPRRSRIFGRWFRWTGTQDDRPVRLFKKSGSRFCQPIHETLATAGTPIVLKNHLNHYTYDGVGDYLKRLNRYTSMEARLLKDSGRPSRRRDLTARPLAVFAKLYFMKLGLLDGAEGFFFSALSGYYAATKHFKRLEADGVCEAS